MTKRNSKTRKSKSPKKDGNTAGTSSLTEPKKPIKAKEQVTTLDAVEAMSSSDEGSVELNNSKHNKEFERLRASIANGSFDKVLSSEKQEDDDSDSIEEVVLGGDDSESGDIESQQGSSSDAKDQKIMEEGQENLESTADSETKAEVEEATAKEEKENVDRVVAEDGDSEEGEDEDEEEPIDSKTTASSKAILAVTEELRIAKHGFPWVETFCVIPSTPLPFGTQDEETGMTIDVHDDLKREVFFHDLALEAALEARAKCKEIGVPFSRPEDYFAEMVKTDDHMARVKDRLIFETKKIEAVSQRKSKKEQMLRSKEDHANRIAEKSRKKKENLKAVEDWSKIAAGNRNGKLNDGDDMRLLSNMSRREKGVWKDKEGNFRSGPNLKRQAADKKYGFGGKRGRFKQNDSKSMNDMSAYNPRGNFAGGRKRVAGGGPSKRPGKRARDASRSRARS